MTWSLKNVLKCWTKIKLETLNKVTGVKLSLHGEFFTTKTIYTSYNFKLGSSMVIFAYITFMFVLSTTIIESLLRHFF